jgi:hypothetical protein
MVGTCAKFTEAYIWTKTIDDIDHFTSIVWCVALSTVRNTVD